MATRYSSRTDKTYPSVFNSDPQHEGNPFSSTPATANEPTQPDVIWPEPWRTLASEYAWGTQVPSNTNVPSQPNASNTDQQEGPGLAKGKMKYGLKMAWAMGVQGDDSRNIYKSVKITTSCPCCSQAHPIYHCELFKGKTPGERFELAKRKNLCYNCLKSNQIKQLGRTVKHTARSCPSKFKCKIEGCGALHHTLLHKPESLKETAEEKDKNIELPTVTSSTAMSKAPRAVL